jgi:hypothetical protein
VTSAGKRKRSSDDVVSIKVRLTVVDRLRSGLAHVVQERSEPQDEIPRRRRVDGRKAVHEHVVGVEAILRYADALGDFRQYVRQQAALAHELDADRRLGSALEELRKLVPDPLGRHACDQRRRCPHRLEGRLAQHELEASGELARAQHTERVLDERFRPQDIDAARRHIRGPTVRIDEHPFRNAPRHHVHAKIAPAQVVLEADVRTPLDREVAVPDAGRTLPPRQRDVDRRAVERALYDRERSADDIGAADATQPLDEIVEADARDHVVEILRRPFDAVER